MTGRSVGAIEQARLFLLPNIETSHKSCHERRTFTIVRGLSLRHPGRSLTLLLACVMRREFMTLAGSFTSRRWSLCVERVIWIIDMATVRLDCVPRLNGPGEKR